MSIDRGKAITVDREVNANSRTMHIPAGWQKTERTTVRNLKSYNNADKKKYN